MAIKAGSLSLDGRWQLSTLNANLTLEGNMYTSEVTGYLD